MTYNREQFYKALLDALQAPPTDANLDALRAWGECEGSNAEWNPLDTTQHEEGATEYNSFKSGTSTLHVWNYPDIETGVRATVTTLENGYYPHILAALREGTGRIVQGEARNEMRTWGTNADCIAGKIATADKDKDHDDTTSPPQQESTPLAFTEEVRGDITRLAHRLSNREHRLTDHDEMRLAHLADAIKHARRVK